MISNSFTDKWGFASFLLLLLFMGLFYQVAWQYPVIDSFPLIERLLNPTFLANDFFTNTFSEFSPRLALAKAIVWLSQILNIDYQYIVAYSNILRIWLYGIGLYLLFLNLAGKQIALIAFSFSALSFLSMPFLPAWWPITYDLTSSNIALVFAMFAWVYALRGQVPHAFLLLTFAVMIHPVVGVQALIICIILYLSKNTWAEFLKLFTTLSIYPFALAFTAAFLFNYMSYEQVLPDHEFISINGHFRHGHHFIFSHMAIEKWASTLLMLTACIAITFALRKPEHKNIECITYSVIAYSILLTSLSYLFAELYPTRFMISFIPMRGFPILVPIIVLAFARLAYEYWNKEKFSHFFLLFLPFLPYNHVGLTWFLLPNHHELVLPILMTILVLLIIFADQLGFYICKPIDNILKKLVKQSPLTVIVLPVALAAIALAILRFNINVPTYANSASIYQWLNKNTSDNEVIITELNAANNQKLRLLARRAVIVSKDFPFNELFYQQWYQRYTDLYQHRDIARGRIDSLSESELNTLMDTYQAHILLRTQPFSAPSHFTLIGESQGENAIAYIYRNNEITTDE